MKIKFVDKNLSLVTKIAEAVKYFPKDIEVACDDIFASEGVIASASNPDFTMGGGLDALIKDKYPDHHPKPGKNQRIGDVIYTITVGQDLKSTRELVAKALKFALKKTKKNKTVLISGLGTGIGELDEDDFVWLFLVAVSEHYGYGWGIKFLRKNKKDHYTGKIKYNIGKWLEEKDAPKDGEDCGIGLHLGTSFVGAGNYGLPESIMFCIYNKEDLCGSGSDKVRVSKLLPVCDLPKWLGYGTNGKKILKKINKKFNPEKYNPYQATSLPPAEKLRKFNTSQVRDQVWDQVWDQVRDQVGDQVWDQVRDQVWDQVRDQVGGQVRDQVWDQVGGQVRDQVRDQVGGQVWDQVWDQVWGQVWDQVGVVSCLAVGIHFELKISHWFSDFIKLGVMLIFVDKKVKVFGKKGMFLGEYDESEIINA